MLFFKLWSLISHSYSYALQSVHELIDFFKIFISFIDLLIFAIDNSSPTKDSFLLKKILLLWSFDLSA